MNHHIDPTLLQQPRTHDTDPIGIDNQADLEGKGEQIDPLMTTKEEIVRNIPGVPSVLEIVATKISFFALQTCLYFFYSTEKSITCDCDYSSFMGIPCVHKINLSNSLNQSLELSDFHLRWHIIERDSKDDLIPKEAPRAAEEVQAGEKTYKKLWTEINQKITEMKPEQKEDTLKNLKKLITGAHTLQPVFQEGSTVTYPSNNPSFKNGQSKARGRPKGSKNKKKNSGFAGACQGLSEIHYPKKIHKSSKAKKRQHQV